MVNPAVTVVIATYDWSTALRCAVQSVLRQSCDDFELLVVGDGCTDDTAQVMARAMRVDRRVRWIGLTENAGTQAVPNNVGIDEARGSVIAYLGHDDLWLPHHLAVMTEAFAATNAAVVHTQACLIDPGVAPRLHPGPAHRFEPGDWIPPTATAHRRDAVVELGGWRVPDASGTRDPEADLWARLHDRHGEPLILPDVTAIKLSAASRRGVYARRPSTEQHRWLDRVERSADPAAMLGALVAAGAPTEGVHQPPPAVLADPTADAATRHRVRRTWKGLPG